MREADISRHCLATGLASLCKANHMEHGLYNQAFFNLSIGLERLLKLIVVIDSALTSGGTYITAGALKSTYGHDLASLFDAAEAIRARRVADDDDFKWDIVDRDVAAAILGVLSEFAQATRYYNLDLLGGNGSPPKGRDPIEAWFSEVGGRLEVTYGTRRRSRDERFAQFLGEALGDSSAVLQETEDGRAIRDLEDSSRHANLVAHVQREATFHGATIVRYLAEILAKLNRDCGPTGVIQLPFLWEFFAVYNNDDKYLKGRRTFDR